MTKPLSLTLEGASPAPVHLPAASKRERDHDYRSVVVYLTGKCRVIECKDSIQWIIQRLRGNQWHGYSFHRNRDVLIERSKATGKALAALKTLPAWYPDTEATRPRPIKSKVEEAPIEAVTPAPSPPK